MMDHEPLGAGARLHSQGAVQRANLKQEIESIIGFEEVIPEAPKPAQRREPARVGPQLAVNEATEIAANALITLYCATRDELYLDPDMALTGTVRAAINEMAKALATPQPDFSASVAMLDLLA